MTDEKKDTQKPKHAGGRPRKNINPDEVYRLAKLGCKITEIANLLGCATDVLHRRYAAEIKKGKAECCLSLRMLQLKSAQQLNSSMLIWLGRQMLNQVDVPIDEEKEETYSPITSLVKND